MIKFKNGVYYENMEVFMHLVVIQILIGLFAGLLAGLFGVGGGVIIIPALVHILHFGQHMAQGTSLMALLLPVGILAVVNYYKAGNVDIKAGLLIGLGLFIGAYFGALIANNLSDDWMRRLFSLFIILVGIKMFFS